MLITPFSKIKIFISYHRDDTAASSGRLFNYLSRPFGKNNVFKDIFSMEGGDKLRQKVRESIENADVFLPVIGTKWIEIQKTSNFKNTDSEDWVEFETKIALEKGLIIIPILVDNASMPDGKNLSERIKQLAEINASELTFKHYDYDVKNLVRDIKIKVRATRRKELRIFNWIFSLLILIAVSGSIFLIVNKLNSFTIGEKYGGGIIVDLDNSKRHGIICSPTDINTSLDWNNSIAVCIAYRGGGFTNWRLPTKDELADLYSNRALIKNFATECNKFNFGNCSYWSSTSMDNTTYAWSLYFTNGLFWNNYDKKGLARVRAVRDF